MCTYTAEELLIAANMLPVRVLGAHEPQNVTEPHIFGMFLPVLLGFAGAGPVRAIRLLRWRHLDPVVYLVPPDL